MQTQSELIPESPQRIRRCRHIFTAGRQCGSPCLRTEQFCYFHHTTRRPVSDPKARLARTSTYDLPVPEDRDSIRAAIAQVMHDIANNHIDLRRAGLILYSLQIALCALPKESTMSQLQSQPAKGLSIFAAARPSTSRRAPHKSGALNHIAPEPSIEELVLDDTYGLIAPETFLGPDPAQQPEEKKEDPGDEVLEDGNLLRNTLGYKLLKDVELYESRTQGWHRGRVDALKDAANAAAASVDDGATAFEILANLNKAAADAVATEAAFSAEVAAGMAKSSFYTGRDPGDAEVYPAPQLEPWKSPFLLNLNASAEPVAVPPPAVIFIAAKNPHPAGTAPTAQSFLPNKLEPSSRTRLHCHPTFCRLRLKKQTRHRTAFKRGDALN